MALAASNARSIEGALGSGRSGGRGGKGPGGSGKPLNGRPISPGNPELNGAEPVAAGASLARTLTQAHAPIRAQVTIKLFTRWSSLGGQSDRRLLREISLHPSHLSGIIHEQFLNNPG